MVCAINPNSPIRWLLIEHLVAAQDRHHGVRGRAAKEAAGRWSKAPLRQWKCGGSSADRGRFSFTAQYERSSTRIANRLMCSTDWARRAGRRLAFGVYSPQRNPGFCGSQLHLMGQVPRIGKGAKVHRSAREWLDRSVRFLLIRAATRGTEKWVTSYPSSFQCCL